MSLELTMADSSSSCQKSTLESNGNPKNVENAYSDIDLLFHKNFLEEGNNFFQGAHICFTDIEEMSSSNENFDSYNLMRDNYEFGLPISNILFENIKPEHGYNKKSDIFSYLIKYMTSLNKDEKRQFLIFTTGASRLPLGGFKSLNPKLTVVKKSMNGNENPDKFWPTVMTCQNYLKIPEYSSYEILKEKFNLAMNEGGNEFHLS